MNWNLLSVLAIIVQNLVKEISSDWQYLSRTTEGVWWLSHDFLTLNAYLFSSPPPSARPQSILNSEIKSSSPYTLLALALTKKPCHRIVIACVLVINLVWNRLHEHSFAPCKRISLQERQCKSVCVCTHTTRYIHTYIHTYVHMCMHTYICACIHTYVLLFVKALVTCSVLIKYTYTPDHTQTRT